MAVHMVCYVICVLGGFFLLEDSLVFHRVVTLMLNQRRHRFQAMFVMQSILKILKFLRRKEKQRWNKPEKDILCCCFFLFYYLHLCIAEFVIRSQPLTSTAQVWNLVTVLGMAVLTLFQLTTPHISCSHLVLVFNWIKKKGSVDFNNCW